MSSALAPEPVSEDTAKLSLAARRINPPFMAWCLVALVFAINVPALLRMGLDADPTFWDLCARNVLRGGVHYRDAVENNLPGMLWLHLAIRSVLGWSSEALRFADLVMVTSIVALLLDYVPAGQGSIARPLTASAIIAFYFSTSEWCHCQRDVWMLLPSLIAMRLRERQLRRLRTKQASVLRIVGFALVEGLAWACAFWIKPHVVVPAVCVWVVGALGVLAYRPGMRLWSGADLMALLAGGILAGAAGTAWIVFSGGVSAFREIMFDWNRQYVNFDVSMGSSTAQIIMSIVLHLPWVLINVPALAMALATLFRGLRQPEYFMNRDILLEVLYLGWFGQTLLLQHPYDYVYVPSIFLAITVTARGLARLPRAYSVWGVAFLLFVAWAANVPKTLVNRLELWPRCLLGPNSPKLQDDLSLYGAVSWQDLDRVATYLRDQQVEDGEVTCYAMRTMPLYEMLNLRPSTRFYSLENCVVILGKQRSLIKEDLARSPQRFVVHDLRRLGLSDEQIARAEGGPLPIPQYDRQPMPWSNRIVYRSGRYVVLAVSAAEMPGWIESSFGL